MISLNHLLRNSGLPATQSDCMITGMTLDSRNVKKNDLFAALSGSHTEGSHFIRQAIEKGASAILLASDAMPLPLPDSGDCVYIYHSNPRLALAKLAAAFFQKIPHSQIAVTGTNGKTSTADFIRQLWTLQNLKAASIGTLGVINNAGYHYQGPILTTPDTIMLHHMLQDLTEHQVNHVVMEASSHGLAQYRLDAIPLQAAGFTNLTRDHLDYHHSLEAYFKAKERLFSEILPEGTIAALNADMDPAFLESLIQTVQNRKQELRLVGEKGQFIRLNSVTALPEGQKLDLTIAGQKPFSVMVPLIGRYQIDNILLALALIAEKSSDLEQLIPLLPSLQGVRGRMERAALLSNGAAIYVDYAHTPDALTHLLQSLRPHTENRLHIIFGAGGDRDKGKRPLMAQEAGKYADHVIITDDNPRTENPSEIRQQVKTGLPNASEIADREEAIAKTIKTLQKGDILVVAGKGHEQGQIIGTTVHPFDDVKIIQKYAGLL